MKKDSGFIQIILIIIVFVIVALYLGKNPVAIWEQVKPLFVNFFEFFVNAIEFLIKFVTRVWQNS